MRRKCRSRPSYVCCTCFRNLELTLTFHAGCAMQKRPASYRQTLRPANPTRERTGMTTVEKTDTVSGC